MLFSHCPGGQEPATPHSDRPRQGAGGEGSGCLPYSKFASVWRSLQGPNSQDEKATVPRAPSLYPMSTHIFSLPQGTPPGTSPPIRDYKEGLVQGPTAKQQSYWGWSLMEPSLPSPKDETPRPCTNMGPMAGMLSLVGSLGDSLTGGSPRSRVKGIRGLDKLTGSIWVTN